MAFENFRPIALSAPDSLFGRILFAARLFLDLQVATVYRDLRRYTKAFSGKVLDVGCGSSPYRFLFDQNNIAYVGIDIVDAEKFDYCNADIVPFDGKRIPFADESVDDILCTEVLEHVPHYQDLINEMYRVLKPGGCIIVTVPWSARFHYIPHDFFRYTPTSLQSMFQEFTKVTIENRGTDITSIVAKLIVIWFRNIRPAHGRFNVLTFVLALTLTPFVPFLAMLGHISAKHGFGSDEDPLGYTVFALK